MCVCVCVHACGCACRCMCVGVWVCECVCVCARVHGACVCVCMYLSACVWGCACKCVCACVLCKCRDSYELGHYKQSTIKKSIIIIMLFSHIQHISRCDIRDLLILRKLEFVVDDRQTLQRPQAHGLKAAFVTSGVLQQRLLKVIQRAQGSRHYKGLNGCIDLQRKNQDVVVKNQDTVAMEKNQSAVVRGRGTKTQSLWRRIKTQWCMFKWCTQN